VAHTVASIGVEKKVEGRHVEWTQQDQSLFHLEELNSAKVGNPLYLNNSHVVRAKPLHIYINIQVAITTTTKLWRQHGQSIICSILDSIETLKAEQPETKINIIWVPGHMDIEGNKTADKAAKEAAKSKGNLGTVPFHHRTLKLASNIAIKQTSCNEGEQASKNGKGTARHLWWITTSPQAKRGTVIYNSIGKLSQITQTAWLRTRHCSLNQFLHQFGIEETPKCTCKNGCIESVQHYLVHCPNCDSERDKLRKEVGIGGLWTGKLLGETEFTEHTLEYIESTKRFRF